MTKAIFCFILLLVFLLTFGGAQIVVQTPANNIFNVGDIINANISVSEQSANSGYLNSYLFCDGNSALIGKSYINVQGGQQFSETVNFPASDSGNCSLQASFNGESESSSNFTISDSIQINYHINDFSFFPGDVLILNGTALKVNGNPFNGALIIFSNGIINKTISVVNGEFSYAFDIGNDFPGNYNLSLQALEKDSNNYVINSGKQNLTIEIKSNPTLITILTNSSSIDPPSSIALNVTVEDQAGNVLANKTLVMKIFDPDMNLLQVQSINTPRSSDFYFPGNSSPGFWSFNFYYGNLFSSSEILVGKDQNISTFVSGNNLVVLNTGNVPYNGSVLYSLQNLSGTYNLSLNVSLNPGKSYFYPLVSYHGSYNVSSGGQFLSSITGAAIGLSPGINIVGLILIGVLLAGLIFFIAKKRKKIITPVHKKPNKKPDTSRNYYEVKEKTAYIALLQFSRPFSGLDRISRKYGLPLQRYDARTCQILFYSPSNNAANKIIDFSREIRESAKLEDIRVSIIVNSTKSDGSADSLKNLVMETKKLLGLSTGRITITEHAARLANLKVGFPRNAEIDGISIKIYSI